MTVPLVARGVSLGAITFVAAESARKFGEPISRWRSSSHGTRRSLSTTRCSTAMPS
jgi:hypothetical protein